jgi:hypothetical protein
LGDEAPHFLRCRRDQRLGKPHIRRDVIVRYQTFADMLIELCFQPFDELMRRELSVLMLGRSARRCPLRRTGPNLGRR